VSSRLDAGIGSSGTCGDDLVQETNRKILALRGPNGCADIVWLNGSGNFPAPGEAYYMAGAGGQITLIIPSHDLVVVRLGHYKGQDPGTEAFKKAITLLMQAVPAATGRI
jgi:CubicO group peptidase (beta-lactamase class C family)